MTNRYKPNEAACPVPLEMLSLLLRGDDETVQRVAQGLPEDQRASLAAFCHGRCHLRDLSFKLALLCGQRSLERVAGLTGSALFLRSREGGASSYDEAAPRRRPISLAKVA